MATHNVKVTYSGPAQSQSNPDEVSVSIIGQVQNLKLIKFEELQSKFGSVVNSKVISSSAERGRPRADQAKRLLIFILNVGCFLTASSEAEQCIAVPRHHPFQAQNHATFHFSSNGKTQFKLPVKELPIR